MVERWRQLPLDRALSHSADVRTLVQSLADEVAQSTGFSPSVVPDCGPATLMDQLTVMVYDATTTAPKDPPQHLAPKNLAQDLAPKNLAQDLAALRRSLT